MPSWLMRIHPLPNRGAERFFLRCEVLKSQERHARKYQSRYHHHQPFTPGPSSLSRTR